MELGLPPCRTCWNRRRGGLGREGLGVDDTILLVPPSLRGVTQQHPLHANNSLSLCLRHLPVAGVNLAHTAARSECRKGDTLKEPLPGSGGWGMWVGAHFHWPLAGLSLNTLPKPLALLKNPTRTVWPSSPQQSASP